MLQPKRPDAASSNGFREISPSLGPRSRGNGGCRMIAWADPVGVLCELIEAGNGSLDATAVRERSNADIEFLSSIGAVTAAEPSSIVTCRACDNDHIARLEFDPSTRRHWHFCP